MQKSSSLFELSAVANPRDTKLLEEHYRSKPAIIAASGRHFYDDQLIALRSKSLDQDDVVDIFCEGGKREVFLGTNFTEAAATADRICATVQDFKDHPVHMKPTILAISMGGRRQCSLIKELVEKRRLKPDPVSIL